jgi:hypothetical protein
MSNSVIDNVWMQFTKVGAWMDGPMDNFVIRNSRILDQTADGVNFHMGVTNSTVENTFVRGTGDDGLAMWSEAQVNRNNRFRFNTVGVTILANQIAIYGGTDIQVTDNVVADTLTNGGGIHVGNRYPGVNGATAVSGTFTLARNTLIRAGNSDYNWNFGVGAIWFNGLNEPLTRATINVTDTDIIDSSYAAIHFIEGEIRGVNFNNVNITGAGTFALQIQSPGAASFTNVRATGIAQSNPIYSCIGSGFAITQGAGNSGWYTATPYCGGWPEPRWTDNGTPGPGPTGPGSPPPPPPPPPTTTNPPPPPAGGNLAQGRPVTATSVSQVYVAANAVDGNASTYWESANGSWPQSLTVDLGASRSVNRIVVKLPAGWETRTQTLSLHGSTDGSSYAQIVGPAGYTFNPASGNTATIAFAATSRRYLRLTVTANNGWPAGQASEFEVYGDGATVPPPPPPPTTTAPPPSAGNLAAGRPATATSASQAYVAANTVDGNASTYWESANGSWPQSLTVDLGASRSVSRLVLRLPPATAWGTRTQTLSVLGSTDGSSYATVRSSAGYTFNPASGNTATLTFPAASLRYLRLTFTANTGWPAGQLSEVEAYTT